MLPSSQRFAPALFSQPHIDALGSQSALQVGDGDFAEVEDGGGEARVYFGEGLEEPDEVLRAAGAAGGDDRHVYRVTDGGEEL